MDLSQFTQAFFVEAIELLAEMEQLLLDLDVEAPDSEQLNAIFRAAHSIKGGAATFGFTALTNTTHVLETLLDRARHGQLSLNGRMIDAFLETKDALQEQLTAYQAGQEPNPDMVAHICGVLQQLALESGDESLAAHAAATAAAAPVAAPAPAPVAAAAPAEAAVPAGDGVLRIRFARLSDSECDLLAGELSNLGKVLSRTRSNDQLTVLLETTCDPDDIVAVCCFVIDESQIDITREAAAAVVAPEPAAPAPAAEAPAKAPAVVAAAAPVAQAAPAAPAATAAPAAAAGTKESSSIRVDVEKVDQLINLVGELVITQSMLTQAATMLDPVAYERFLSGLGHLERNARDLQESVMSIRMMPMDYVFSRFPRVIRDVSAKLGKQVRLDTYGKETELDKGLIERIVDPLTHLVRNSLDHGIETPDVRLAKGKDATGQLLLSAQHHGGNIVIEVSDDGAGLNRERILAKALQQGLPVSETMPDEEVWQLIFAPGFSTAEQVTDISGRGVGMDVVKRNIQEMGGHVEIHSRGGQGTTTRIVLPLTLAILNGMSVKVGDEAYILPLSYVIESLQPLPEHLHSITADGHVIRVRGEYLPLIELHRVFDVAGAQTHPTQGILVIVQADDSRFALLVDELLGQHQVVVKNLETNYRKVPGISAATILGDGSVAFIIDVGAMPRIQRAQAASAAALAGAARRTDAIAL
ncbi:MULTISPECIES: chemotaxis protein CheA [Variovorax]|jgi:two-component system, chemotaxis family, sensor kinase CheA|uniref:chemotaxis protein CheA n=1 Tax=Variovorax TaxID=34072 RepID=UPI00086DC599|nr:MULTISPECIES: chemotaxis protein CheA [Variovorax]MBN8757142.1 chemotaxis protein CheA [Variovorax sp.]ODU17898.1 MAG: chemotaxis protein CheA [Variovorax sp. SCN 67-85]ODV24433.1 MAG: chemotaxis protein CheA [Variovorax sp. SCN 67-20]OJZ13627.1 MAG: chemotaxis protein CheA [Variovorax sp. 67-131]UKI06283.1 chemotaxis protein CheA [Variovorax paradoxus]